MAARRRAGPAGADAFSEMMVQDAIGRPLGISSSWMWLLDHGFAAVGDNSFERNFDIDGGNFSCLLGVMIRSDGICLASMTGIEGYMVYLAKLNISPVKVKSIFGKRYCGTDCTMDDFTGSSAEEAMRKAVLDGLRIAGEIREEMRKVVNVVGDSRQEYFNGRAEWRL